ncbi:MAG: N-acetylmuramoyl-L-alanine amidase [Deltaproteobacteria bacterium]|nr:N-acetylmuramoyl-L-alanine amidase [Deltaproteobacteria bacterium]MBW2383436.1 N-acetylmuramoyl-L-alanine amidase [Deltaproteobacteria bacterium]MBW2695096.1 N-acetylmuramoyl-L-alanine amidase [Deltaproteobacteria bacterium]
MSTPGTRQRRSRRLLLGIVCLLVPSLMGVERPSGLGDVKAVRTWSYPDYTRVVIELTRPVQIEEEALVRLAADRGAKRPERLYVDLPEIWVGREYKDGVPVGDGLLQAVRLGQNTLRKSRLVIDLQRYGSHRMFTLPSPDRLVVDVYGARGGARTSPATGGGQKKAVRLPMAIRPLRTVVIDPGHGGKDPGAIGIGGIREKDVNLRLAKLLARRLRARSFKVVMTRSRDRYVDLEERTAIAESSDGDIFVSIHSNAARSRALRGIEIYYLDEGHKRHNLEVAARENGVQPGQLDSLQRTLSRLRVSEASHHSRTLATFVHDDLVAGLAQTHRSVPDLGVKRGPFYVLFMSSMPAILIETGFLTNRQDAKLLRSEDYLDTLAAQIASGLGHYRNRGRQRTAEARSDSGLPQVGAR